MHLSALRHHRVNGGRVEIIDNHYRLIVPAMPADSYTDAQLDDYEHELPRTFPNLPPQHLRLRVRYSANELKGTAGFGFWNHPFGREGAVMAPPCNVWFFYSSPDSDMQIAHGMPGHGFKASMLNSGQIPAGIMAVAGRALNMALKIPLISAVTMNAARASVKAREVALDLDMMAWHTYEIIWTTTAAVFKVDGRDVLTAHRPPTCTLGFAAWVDNYRATANGRGDYQFAYVDIRQEQWMELEIIDGDE